MRLLARSLIHTRLLLPCAVSVLGALALAAPAAEAASPPPNVLLIMADDCTYNDLPLYGGTNAVTPNIDRLATEGMVFDKAYLAEAMCQPCRAELYSGQYPVTNGCAWNHSASRPTTTSMPQHLGGLGYRVGIAGKVHVKPAAAFPFEDIAGFEKSCVREETAAHDLAPLGAFMGRDDPAPFCAVVALVEPHVPWTMGDASQYPPADIELPPNIADTPDTRDSFSRYLAEITYMDGQVGDILDALEESGKAGDTLVLFTSEQGSQFPGCKWTNWDTGVHTALIARWPGRVEAGARSSALVQYADVLPTLLDAAGGEVDDEHFDGSSFLAVLTGQAERHRDYAYGIHNNYPEGPPYPIRTVTDGTHRYIRNLAPGNLYIEKHLMGFTGEGKLANRYWNTWVKSAWQSDRTYALVSRYQSRPAEEFYHTTEDPYEMANLADAPESAETLRRLSAALDGWLEEGGDPGAAMDTPEVHGAAKRGEHGF